MLPEIPEYIENRDLEDEQPEVVQLTPEELAEDRERIIRLLRSTD